MGIERVKSAFNCQAPERATLSPERLEVEHAIAQMNSILGACHVCDASQLDRDEITLDSAVAEMERHEDEVVAVNPALSSTSEPPADLLDMSEETGCPTSVSASTASENLIDLFAADEQPATAGKGENLSSSSIVRGAGTTELLDISETPPLAKPPIAPSTAAVTNTVPNTNGDLLDLFEAASLGGA